MANITGTPGDDSWLPGTPGDDVIHGLGGSDSLWGGTGNNFLFGDDGDDNLVGASGTDHLDGGAGFDIASYQLSNGPVNASLADQSLNTGDAAGDTFTNMEAITGSPYGGTYYGDNTGQVNQLWAFGGTNYLYAGTGYATLISGPGDDHMFGGAGKGLVDYETATAGVTASLSNPAINTGEAHGDTYSNLFDLAGSAFSDDLYGDDNFNNFIGLAGDDTIHGFGGNDTFTSNAGADTMYGGAGTDLFVFGDDDLASAQLGKYDRVVDFNQGNSGHFDRFEFDGIDLGRITSLASAYAHGTAATSLVRIHVDHSHTFSNLEINVGGTWLTFVRLDGIVGGEQVRVVLDDSQQIGVNITADASIDLGGHGSDWQVAGIGDFNRDGTSDILWRNPTTGQMDQWKMANGNWGGSTPLGGHGTDWQVAGIGDFNGDGTSDILWRNPTTGQMDQWRMGNGNWAGSVSLGSHGTDQVAAVGDFSGDGTSDILWRNPNTGQTDEWRIVNGQWAGSVNPGLADPSLSLAGVGDIDHSGTADVLWRDASGHVSAWLL